MFELATGLVPTGAVECENCMSARSDLRADFRQVQVHRLGVDERQHQGCSYPSGRTDGAEQVGPIVSLVARRTGTAALVGPDIGQAALLADAGFVLPPEFDRLAACVFGNGGDDQVGKVFLCVSRVSASCLG